jgi:superfamily II DNA or RNA helicase
MTIQLYPHQLEAIEGLYQAIRQGHKSMVLRAETGFGKTYVTAEILRRAGLKGSRGWFVVPRKELLRQTAKSFINVGVKHTYIASGKQHRDGVDIKLCSLQTLRSRMDSIRHKPDFIIIDETHYGGSDIDRVVQYAKDNGILLIGCTATPLLGNGDGLGKWYDVIVETKPMRWLIDNGYLSDYRMYAPVKPNLDGVKVRGGEFVQSDLEERLYLDNQRVSGAVTTYRKHCDGKLTIVFGTSLKDCERITEQFNNECVPAQMISSRNTDTERKRIITDFANGTKPVLVNVDLVTFGFDLAAQVNRDVTVEAMIDLAPTMSEIKQRQKWGRVLRAKPYPALIFDHAGNVDRHGMPCAARVWELGEKPKRTRASSERTIAVRQCDNCYFCHPPEPTCPNCGHEYPYGGRDIAEVEAELAEIKAAEVQDEKRQMRMEVGRARTRAELERIAKERGYSRGWIFKQCQIKGIR